MELRALLALGILSLTNTAEAVSQVVKYRMTQKFWVRMQQQATNSHFYNWDILERLTSILHHSKTWVCVSDLDIWVSASLLIKLVYVSFENILKNDDILFLITNDF